MDIVEFRDYCMTKTGAEECLPFDDNVLVFKVAGKMFAYAGMNDFRWFNVKCEPDRAEELRAIYPEVKPGVHASKKHWNSVAVTGQLKESFLREQIDRSYELVISSLSRKQREEWENKYLIKRPNY